MSADDDQPAEIPCPPCRATGSVVSNLGGTAQQVTCPWCDGSGRLTPGGDAQAKWQAERASESPSGEPEPPAAA